MSVTITDYRPSILITRNSVRQSVPVTTWDAVYSDITLADGGTTEVQDDSLTQYGVVTRISVTIAENTNSKGVTITIDDKNGKEIFNSGILAHNATHLLAVDITLVGKITLGAVAEADPGEDFLVGVILTGEG